MLDTEIDVRIYELGYWFVPTIPEDGIEAQVTELKQKLSAKGAVFIQEENPYLREIAYEMKKVIDNKNNYFTEGYFGWIKFEMDPAKVETLKNELELDPSVIRAMIIQTVRENTVYAKRPATHKRDEEEDEVEIVEEDADITEDVVVEATPALAEEDSVEVEK